MNDVTLAVLAGGRARRMGGQDKGLVTVAGKPMIQHVLDRISQPDQPAMVIANRHQDQYAEFGYPVFSDALADFPGPLAGIAVALQHSDTEWVLVCPCDTPQLPPKLMEQMLATQREHQAEVVVAHDGEYEHSVVLLLSTSLLPSLSAYLEGGDRKVDLWYGQHAVARCYFEGQASAFANINTPEQRQQLELELLGQ
ncbi:molybdenum cofactor guanylyltransferase MobA [Ferrimonas gelatinilytica]|uniref:Molybdenum cofactor guanylyltransferase n=1 Tax=Ferrimonas gelatinilytica TaxID=1255257 RepID=A0ABP9RTB1_9GAMM